MITVSPTAWPTWATTEDGDQMWVRADLAVAEVYAQVREWSRFMDDADMFVPTGPMVMWLDLDAGWGEWRIREVHDDAHDPQEVRVYLHFEWDPDSRPCPERCYENTRRTIDGPTMLAGGVCGTCGGYGRVALSEDGGNS